MLNSALELLTPETKLTELGMLASQHFKICFVLDKTSMFRIISEQPGKGGNGVQEVKHSVKPLQLIWAKFPFWNPRSSEKSSRPRKRLLMTESKALRILSRHYCAC